MAMTKTKTTVTIPPNLMIKAMVAMTRDHRSMNSLICKALEVYCLQVQNENPDEWDDCLEALADMEQVDIDKAKLERQLGDE